MVSWFKNIFKSKSPPTGEELIVSMYVEQVCSLFDIPIQKPPKVIVVAEKNNKIAEYEYLNDTIYIYGKENVTSGIVAHELTHAVIYKYGQINVKMYEILAGYAEYKLKDLIK